MTRLSNLHGRLLEYLIVETLSNLDPQIKLSDNAKLDQLRDSSKATETETKLRHNLNQAAKSIVNDWLYPRFLLPDLSVKEIDRLPDQNKSDVTDIRVITERRIINLSIKHNHSALRHQRPRTTPQHCGFSNGSSESEFFKKQYNEIVSHFTSGVVIGNKFNELSEGYVEGMLYIPVCELVKNFINTYSVNCTNYLFRYLIGDIDYYKIIVDSSLKQIQIQEFNSSSLSYPFDVIVKTERQYVYLNFDNDWKIKMRLHTASSKITKSPSLKFDTQLSSSNVLNEILIYD